MARIYALTDPVREFKPADPDITADCGSGYEAKLDVPGAVIWVAEIYKSTKIAPDFGTPVLNQSRQGAPKGAYCIYVTFGATQQG